jgi:hypothetical protein
MTILLLSPFKKVTEPMKLLRSSRESERREALDMSKLRMTRLQVFSIVGILYKAPTTKISPHISFLAYFSFTHPYIRNALMDLPVCFSLEQLQMR